VFVLNVCYFYIQVHTPVTHVFMNNYILCTVCIYSFTLYTCFNCGVILHIKQLVNAYFIFNCKVYFVL